MTLAHKIQGESMQMIVFQLDEGQRVYAEAGKFLWKTVNVEVETRLSKGDPTEAEPAPAGAAGLLNKALKTGVEMGKRHLAGESVAFQHFTATGGSGLVAFAGTLPGTMRAIELDGDRRLDSREGRVRVRREHRQLRHRLPGVQGRPQERRGVRAREVHRGGHAGHRRRRQLHRAQPGQVRRHHRGRHRVRRRLPGLASPTRCDASAGSTPRASWEPCSPARA